MNAESAYLFRHALLRDAAYQLQMPGDRAQLHALAFSLIEELAGGRAPEVSRTGGAEDPVFHPHPTDPFAEELAEHVLAACAPETAGSATISNARELYLGRAAALAGRRFQHDKAGRLWQKRSNLVQGDTRGESLRQAANEYHLGGWPGFAEPLYRKALAASRAAKNRRLLGVVQADFASLLARIGRAQRAEEIFRQALANLREVEDRRAEGIALRKLSGLLRDTGRAEIAERLCNEALAIHREVGDRRSEGIALGILATMHRDFRRVENAEQVHREALVIHQET